MRRSGFINIVWFIAIITKWFSNTACSEEIPSLVLEAKIPLGDVGGRIDHLAIDIEHQRLFVAELSNDSVGVIDLKASKVIFTLNGFHEPQGIGYDPFTDTLYVANGGDGSVTMLRGKEPTGVGSIKLGDDADNVRVDTVNHRVVVGYGDALALIDAMDATKVHRVVLKGHPEGFQIDAINHRVFVNVPDAHQIAVIDALTHQQARTWPTALFSSNFPMAIDAASQRVLVMFRHPASLNVFNMSDGHVVASVPACGDADDVFFDALRSLVYVSCGDGYLDVLSFKSSDLSRAAHIKTVSGARTSLFVPELNKLFLAVRATSAQPAAIWVYRTNSLSK